MSVLEKLPDLSEGKLSEIYCVKMTAEQKDRQKHAARIAREAKKDMPGRIREMLDGLARQIIREQESA